MLFRYVAILTPSCRNENSSSVHLALREVSTLTDADVGLSTEFKMADWQRCALCDCFLVLSVFESLMNALQIPISGQ